MRYHLFQKFFGKMVKIKETSLLSAKKSSFLQATIRFQKFFFLAFCIEQNVFFPETCFAYPISEQKFTGCIVQELNQGRTRLVRGGPDGRIFSKLPPLTPCNFNPS